MLIRVGSWGASRGAKTAHNSRRVTMEKGIQGSRCLLVCRYVSRNQANLPLAVLSVVATATPR